MTVLDMVFVCRPFSKQNSVNISTVQYDTNLYDSQGHKWIKGTAWKWTILCTV